MKVSVLVTNENPFDAVRSTPIPGACKVFDSMDKAYKFVCDMLALGFNISLNAWNEEEG